MTLQPLPYENYEFAKHPKHLPDSIFMIKAIALKSGMHIEYSKRFHKEVLYRHCLILFLFFVDT